MMTLWHIMATLFFVGAGTFAFWSLISDFRILGDYLDKGRWGGFDD